MVVNSAIKGNWKHRAAHLTTLTQDANYRFSEDDSGKQSINVVKNECHSWHHNSQNTTTNFLRFISRVKSFLAFVMKNYLILLCFDSFAPQLNSGVTILPHTYFRLLNSSWKKEFRFSCHLDIKTMFHITDLQKMLAAALLSQQISPRRFRQVLLSTAHIRVKT